LDLGNDSIESGENEKEIKLSSSWRKSGAEKMEDD
jgi:hypothetical protein